MTEPVILAHTSESGTEYTATFLPHHGMTLASFKKDGVEVIDQATKRTFEERSAGLGVLIGPHFHRRKTDLLPHIDKEFPQSAYCKAHGIEDIFSHGVARYVPWKWEKIHEGIKASLSGKDLWQEVPLSTIEGQNFQMGMTAHLNGEGLKIFLSVVSDSDSLVGLHYYYRLPNGKGTIKSKIRIPSTLEEKELVFPVNQPIDATFHPHDPLKGHILLETEEFVLNVGYTAESQENSWQLYHPEGASFICIEPISAQDPRHPNLSVSSLAIHLQIL